MLLLQLEIFVNLNAFPLQNDTPLVSNKHLISIIGVYLKLSLAMFTRDVLKRTSEESASHRYSILELSKYGLVSSKISSLQNTIFSLIPDLDK